MLSGQLKDMLMRVYDMRSSTAEEVMQIAEIISNIAKREYVRGYYSVEEHVVIRKEET